MEVVAIAIYPLNFCFGSSVSLATVRIIFTKILNVILASYYNCLVQLVNGLVQLCNTFCFNNFTESYDLVFALLSLGDENDVSRVKRGGLNKKFEKHCARQTQLLKNWESLACLLECNASHEE